MGVDVLHWILEAKFKLSKHHKQRRRKSSTTASQDNPPQELVKDGDRLAHPQEGSYTSFDTYLTNTTLESDRLLEGLKNDALIPQQTQILETFWTGYSKWCACVSSASKMPTSWDWIQRFELCSILQNVPALPQDLKGYTIIRGSSMWRVHHYQDSDASSDEYLNKNLGGSVDESKDRWDPTLVYSCSKLFLLWASEPLVYNVLSVESQQDYENQYSPESSSDALLILTLCWSYILSAKLAEAQGELLQYNPTASAQTRTEGVVLNLGNASANLVQWLSTLLVSKTPYSASGGSVSPWAAQVSNDLSLVIVSSHLEQAQIAAPTCQEAIGLLKEFCSLYDLGSQPTVALCAALISPLNMFYSLQPCLPWPRLCTSSFDSLRAECVQRYADKLPYFMTLSLRQESLGSALWSSFWEPGVDSNLVSAWCAAILQSIQPLITKQRLIELAKVISQKRPRLALLWIGVAACGNLEMIKMITSYLTTLQEREDGPIMSRPDTDTAYWTGSPQSFLDEELSGFGSEISKADLLRLRFDYRLPDHDMPQHGWQPSGLFNTQDAEPELLTLLNHPSRGRQYVRWTWWLKPSYLHDYTLVSDPIRPQEGLDSTTTVQPMNIEEPVIKERPSRDATVSVLIWGSKTAPGDRYLESIASETVMKHPWFEDTRM